MDRPDWAPETIEVERPSVARMYDYYLGGSHNFAADRAAAKAMVAAVPDAAADGAGQPCLPAPGRAVPLDAGIRQFLDIGSGIPTVGNVHEIAQRRDPDARVVYVDIDPVAVAHSREILAGNDRHRGRSRRTCATPKAILAHPEVTRLLDFTQPVAVHDRGGAALRPGRRRARPRSCGALRAAAGARQLPGALPGERGRPPDGERAEAEGVYRRTDNPLCIRSRAELTDLSTASTWSTRGWSGCRSGGRTHRRARRTPSKAVFMGGVGRLGA